MINEIITEATFNNYYSVSGACNALLQEVAEQKMIEIFEYQKKSKNELKDTGEILLSFSKERADKVVEERMDDYFVDVEEDDQTKERSKMKKEIYEKNFKQFDEEENNDNSYDDSIYLDSNELNIYPSESQELLEDEQLEKEAFEHDNQEYEFFYHYTQMDESEYYHSLRYLDKQKDKRKRKRDERDEREEREAREENDQSDCKIE